MSETITISELDPATFVQDGDLAVIVQNNVTLNITRELLVGSGNNTIVNSQPVSPVVYGYWNTASGDYAVALGLSNNLDPNNTASGRQSIAIGYSNQASGIRSLACGQFNVSSYGNCITVGTENTASGYYSIAIGVTTTSSGYYSIAIGTDGTRATAESTIAIGDEASADETNAIAIGRGSQASQENTIAIGNNANATDTGAVAIGNSCLAQAENTLAIGGSGVSGNFANDEYSIAVGYDNQCFGSRCTGVGNYNQAQTFGNTVVGTRNTASGFYSTAVGYDNNVANSGMAFGAYNQALGSQSTAIGYNNDANALRSLALGYNNNSNYSAAITVGVGNTSSAYGMGVGWFNTASGLYSVVFGYQSNASNARSVAIGVGANANGISSVAIGDQATARINYTTNTKAIINRRDNGEALGLEFQNYAGAEVVLLSKDTNLSVAADYVATLPAGCSFYPDEVGLIITTGIGVSSQPTIRFGDETPAPGNIGLNQQVHVDGDFTGGGISWIATTNPGSLLVATLTCYENGTPTPPSGWVLAAAANAGLGQTYIWYIPNASARSGTESFSFDSIGPFGFGLLSLTEWSGLDTNPLDQAAGNTSSTLGSNADSGTTGTTAQANELWIASLMNSGGQPFDPPNIGVAEVLAAFGAGSSLYGGIYAAVNPGVGPANINANFPPSANWAGAIATFKGAFTPTYDDLLDATQTTGLTTTKNRQKFTVLKNYDGHTTLTAGVTVPASADFVSGRFYWKGLLIED